jgi:hypothetical protein
MQAKIKYKSIHLLFGVLVLTSLIVSGSSGIHDESNFESDQTIINKPDIKPLNVTVWIKQEITRSMKYTSRSDKEAIAWQNELRQKLFESLKLADLVLETNPNPFLPEVLSTEKNEKYTLQEIEVNTTPGRRIKFILTLPVNSSGPCPVVVCIHGHGGDRHVVYDTNSVYLGFASVLAQNGYATISTEVGQHEVFEKDRILMGERLWDLMRCVDYLESHPEVDKSRIGCAGLSLGGEMAMWLGAMDTRISATVSSGFLTKMDQMEQNHCMCWKFTGLRELVDFADIYSLIAPRPLLCQNGLKEPPSQFPVTLAREALREIELIYADLNQPENVALVAHEGGHVIDLPSLMIFFEKHLVSEKNTALITWRSCPLNEK